MHPGPNNPGGKLINERVRAIEWLATPQPQRMPVLQEELERELSISQGRIAKWKREDDFVDAVYDRARQIARISHTSEIVESVAKEAIRGNQQAATNYFKYIEQISEKSTVNHQGKVSDLLEESGGTNDKRTKTDRESLAH